jgi:hypothetical protein
MEIADSMKDLSESILASYNVRMKALSDLVSDTRETLGNFAEERKNTAQEQNKYLSDFVNGLSASVDDMLKGFRENRKSAGDEQTKRLEGFARDLTKDTSEILGRFLKDHRHMGNRQTKDLSAFTADLAKNVHTMLKGFYKDHQQMSDEQAKNLANFVNDLTRDVSTMANGFKKERNEMSQELKVRLAGDLKNIRTYTMGKLREFEKSHGEMSDSLKKSLTVYADHLAKNVSRLLQGYRNDMKKAGKSWDRMSSTLSGLRKGTVTPSAATGKRAPDVQETVEADFGQKEAISDLEVEMRILDYIHNHPEGVRVSSMETPLGVHRTRLGIKAKKLLEEGRVRKEENAYYPLDAFRGSALAGAGFSKETH